MSEPTFQDQAPDAPTLTAYDRQHLKTYLRLLDAEADQADWREAAALVLGLDVEADPDRARRMYDSHLARARWMSEHGYRHLLRHGRSPPQA